MSTIINIQHADIVRHRDGKTYRVSEVRRGDIGDGEDRIIIAKEGEGNVFSGTAKQAREQGFAFGSEEFYSNGRPISHFDVPAMTSLAESQFLNVPGDEPLRNVVQFAISAGNEVSRLQMELRGAGTRASAAQQELRDYREQVRDAIVAAQKEHDLCREGTNEVLEALGLRKIRPTFSVEVTRDSDGNTIATITGVEADDEDAAEEYVKQHFTVTATVKKVEYGYEYDGDGESDFDEEEWEDDDLSDEDDEFASNHKYDLTFSATEE
jgi:hypothetical protein